MNVLLIWCVIAYLIGSIPFGYILVKLFLKQDVRKQGSGNIGTTNVLRTGGKKLALATYILDITKVWIPMLLFNVIMNPINDMPSDILLSSLMIVGGTGVIGHMYSCWLKFNGGKGVASFTGFCAWLFPYSAIIGIFVFLIIAFSTKIVSIASLIGIIAAGIYVIFYVFPILDTPTQLMLVSKIFFIFIIVLIFVRHKGNIARLMKGEENKVKF
ncbi:MAG: glycerol-3-phosphate 1-O-acyltransferase PlsY [Alphaproteobacteria bacterium]|nr:glycerol-3-phosphate 1-O-acyltransferase PlsY [Alphaproteobacteria bacterium]